MHGRIGSNALTGTMMGVERRGRSLVGAVVEGAWSSMVVKLRK